jgi:mono/diheme cytochrome c family protein
LLSLFAAALLGAFGCRQQMANQPSYRPLTASDFFPDGRSARPVVPGTVARGQLRTDTELYEGRDEKGEVVSVFPFEMTEAVLERGKQRYTIFCSVCHGLTGHGDGRIVQRGFTKPPDLISDASRYYRLRDPKKEIPLTEVPVGHVFEVIGKGYGAMPSYSAQIPVADRWAITGYVRALQLSQADTEKRPKLLAEWERARGKEAKKEGPEKKPEKKDEKEGEKK